MNFQYLSENSSKKSMEKTGAFHYNEGAESMCTGKMNKKSGTWNTITRLGGF